VIQVEAANMEAHRFLRDFLTLRRPVLVRDAAANSTARRSWTRRAFEEGFADGMGAIEVDVGPVPNPSRFGVDGKRVSISDYVRFMFNSSDSGDGTSDVAPDYLAVGLDPKSVALKDVELAPQFLRDSFLQPGVPELLIGPSGSGTPLHAHGPSANTLLHGRKAWHLYPPAAMQASSTAAREWAVHDLHMLPSDAEPLQCLQRPGDVMFVPEHWSHAVLNLEDTVAVSTVLTPSLHHLK